MSNYTPVDVGGIDVGCWIDLFNGCHTVGNAQFAWPDGKSYLEQENLMVQVFQMIRGQISKVNANGK